jgi:hypothetical protein
MGDDGYDGDVTAMAKNDVPVPPPRPPRPGSTPDGAWPPRPGSRPDGAPAPKEDLAEVERALSILGGRHPGQVRAEREMLEAARARRVAQESAHDLARARDRRKLFPWIFGAVAVVVGISGVAWWIHRASARVGAVDALLLPLAAPYVAHGFHVADRTLFAARDHLEQDVDAGKCVVVLAASASGDDRFEVDRGGPTVDARGSMAWCTCHAEHVKIAALAPGPGRGVLLAQIDARVVGGTLAIPFLDPHPNVVAPAGECASEPLDAWLASRAPTPPIATPWFEGDPRVNKLLASRHGDGAPTPTVLNLVAGVEPSLPFGVVALGGPLCALVLSDDAADLLSLRLPADVEPIAKKTGPIAWCDPKGARVTVWREGKGRVFVLAAPADRLGGMLGLREMVTRAGFGGLTSWVADGDLGWVASAVLRADGIAPIDIKVSTDALARSRVVASAVPGLTPEARERAMFVCAPATGADSAGSLCVEAIPLPWRSIGRVAQGGIAQGTLPFWMHAYEAVLGNEVLKSELALLTLARRLEMEGFEPTIDGVTETLGGVDIVGRSGDSSVVAVGMTGEAPWVLPYTDDDGWTLAGEPRFVAITPGAHVKLATFPASHVAPSKRETVVFRRADGGR